MRVQIRQIFHNISILFVDVVVFLIYSAVHVFLIYLELYTVSYMCAYVRREKKQDDGTVNILLRHRSASLFEAALALVLQICRGIRSNPGEVLLDAWFLSD